MLSPHLIRTMRRDPKESPAEAGAGSGINPF
jgi:hypothetical protein